MVVYPMIYMVFYVFCTSQVVAVAGFLKHQQYVVHSQHRLIDQKPRKVAIPTPCKGDRTGGINGMAGCMVDIAVTIDAGKKKGTRKRVAKKTYVVIRWLMVCCPSFARLHK